MGETIVLVLRAIHILAGIFWVGGAVIVGLFIFPAIRAAGASGQPVLVEIMLRRKLAVYIPLSAVLTMLAGFALFYRNMSLSGGAWARSPMGGGMSVGVVTAIIAAIFGMGVAAPAARKLAGAGQAAGAPALTADERTRLQKRAQLGSVVAMVMLVVAATAMAVARYL
jgi:uncharacterized membrane protein